MGGRSVRDGGNSSVVQGNLTLSFPLLSQQLCRSWTENRINYFFKWNVFSGSKPTDFEFTAARNSPCHGSLWKFMIDFFLFLVYDNRSHFSCPADFAFMLRFSTKSMHNRTSALKQQTRMYIWTLVDWNGSAQVNGPPPDEMRKSIKKTDILIVKCLLARWHFGLRLICASDSLQDGI